MPTSIVRCFGILLASVLLSACGDGESTRAVAGGGADCPPNAQGDGLMVGSRYDYEAIIAANRWREAMFPASCAGAWAELVPALPNGFGVMPSHKPYVMNDEQIYLRFAELPTPLYNDEDIANVPIGIDSIEFEVVRFSPDELKALQAWMDKNPKSFVSRNLADKTVYLMGGGATGRPGKGDRLSGGLIAIFDSGLVIKLSHRSLYSRGELELSGVVTDLMAELVGNATAAGF